MEEYFMNQRRLRLNQHIRELSSKVWLNHKQFIQPLFVSELLSKRTLNPTLNHISTDTIESVIDQIGHDLSCGITKFLLFPIPIKTSDGGLNFEFARAVVGAIKQHFGNQIWLAVDLCLCAYTQHGHCGLLNKEATQIDNNASVIKLTEYAQVVAEGGADCIAPSDMMDGRISSIRKHLDNISLDHIAILSYSSKFASSFYGPFRDVCSSSPSASTLLKDRRSYQISPSNSKDAIASAKRDVHEGADLVMVKPAMPYLDIIQSLSHHVDVPIAAYQVSGEYQSIELMAQNNLLERQDGHLEAWSAMVRSGANMIISYAARHAKAWIGSLVI